MQPQETILGKFKKGAHAGPMQAFKASQMGKHMKKKKKMMKKY